jgi:hypothetical protein
MLCSVPKNERGMLSRLSRPPSSLLYQAVIIGRTPHDRVSVDSHRMIAFNQGEQSSCC